MAVSVYTEASKHKAVYFTRWRICKRKEKLGNFEVRIMNSDLSMPLTIQKQGVVFTHPIIKRLIINVPHAFLTKASRILHMTRV